MTEDLNVDVAAALAEGVVDGIQDAAREAGASDLDFVTVLWQLAVNKLLAVAGAHHTAAHLRSLAEIIQAKADEEDLAASDCAGSC